MAGRKLLRNPRSACLDVEDVYDVPAIVEDHDSPWEVAPKAVSARRDSGRGHDLGVRGEVGSDSDHEGAVWMPYNRRPLVDACSATATGHESDGENTQRVNGGPLHH